MLRTFLAGLEIAATGVEPFETSVRVWVACEPDESGDVVFEVSRAHGGPGPVHAGAPAHDGGAAGVAANVPAPGFVAACLEPKCADGSALVVRELGTTMDADWDGSVGILDSPPSCCTLAPGDRSVMHHALGYAIGLTSTAACRGTADEAMLERIAGSRAAMLSTLGRGGRNGGVRPEPEHAFHLACDGDRPGGRKNEFCAHVLFRLLKVSRQAKDAPHGEGEPLALALVPIGVDCAVRTSD